MTGGRVRSFGSYHTLHASLIRATLPGIFESVAMMGLLLRPRCVHHQRGQPDAKQNMMDTGATLAIERRRREGANWSARAFRQ